MLIPFQQVGYFICHGEGFCKWIDSKNYFKNDFLFLEMIFVLKLILELKWELILNIKTKSIFALKLLMVGMKFVMKSILGLK